MSNNGYVSSQLVEQGTLLKKFNKLLDIVEKMVLHRYEINFTNQNITGKIYLDSSTEITSENFIENYYKFVNGFVHSVIDISIIQLQYYNTSDGKVILAEYKSGNFTATINVNNNITAINDLGVI